MSNKFNSFGGFSLKIKGKTSLEQIIEEIASNLILLEKEFGVEEFSGINFYSQIYKDGESLAIVRDNTILSGCSANADGEHKKITNIEDGKKTYEYKKGLDFDNLRENVEKKINSHFFKNNNDISILTKKEINMAIAKKEQELKLLRMEQERIAKEEYFAKKAFEKKAQVELNNFKEKFMKDFDITNENYKKKVSSFGKIIQPHIIRSYLEENEINASEYYRVTLKDEKTNKASTVYIYNMELTQVKKIDK